MKTYMAIGGHIGDAELTSGLFLATKSLEGDKIVTVALTGGEKGNPKDKTVEEYLIQKKDEAKKFAEMLGGESIVFPYKDGELEYSHEAVIEVAKLIRKYKPKAIITHWKEGMHKDHMTTSKIVSDAAFLASLDVAELKEYEKHWAPVYFAENWEDATGFKPYIYVKCSSEGFELWKEALHTQWFVMNSPSFKYYDYYTSLAKVRGCLARSEYAIALDVEEHDKKEVWPTL